MWLCLCLFFGNTSIPLSLCQYLYTSSMAISLSLLNNNISMPLLWQYLYASSMAISLCLFNGNFSMPSLWQYLYASSMAISLCLSYGNISMPLLWQCLYASSMTIPLISLLWQYIVAATSNIHLLLRNISFCFCEQSSLEISLLLRTMYFASASNISLLMQAMSLYLSASASNISASASNIIQQLSSAGAKVSIYLLLFFKINFRIIKFYLSAYGYLLFYSANLTAYSPFMSSFFFWESLKSPFPLPLQLFFTPVAIVISQKGLSPSGCRIK